MPMVKSCLIVIVVAASLAGCATLNENPDILLEEPYRRVEYVAAPTSSHTVVDVIQVVTKGFQANILNTIPLLYQKALAVAGDRPGVQISNIAITCYTKIELVPFPYRECRTVRRSVAVPTTTCSGGPCTTTYTMQTQSIQECDIVYRLEEVEVKYQRATAELLMRIKEN